MKRALAVALFGAVMIVGSSWLAFAGDEKKDEHKEAKVMTLKGEIVDTGCYLAHGAKGPDHASCATKCIAGGMPMGLLTSDGVLYLLTMNHDNADPYNQAKKLAASTVEITGPVHERNGVKAIEVTAVKGTGAPVGTTPPKKEG